MADGTNNTPAGWHDDPDDSTQLRYWDGQQWTDHRSPKNPAPAPAAASAEPSGKKSGVPWWVWLIIALVALPVVIVILLAIIGIAVGSSTDTSDSDDEVVVAESSEPSETPVTDEEPAPSPSPEQDADAAAEGDFGPGVWLVGDDIEAGTYRTIEPIEAESIFDACYWSVEEDASGDFEGIIANANVTGGIPTVTFVDGNQFESSDCGDWVRVDTSELFQNDDVSTTITDGVWLVGEDIAPGTYRIDTAIEPEGDFDYCYWGITEGLEGNFADIASNDLVEAGRPTVTLAAGQQFESSDCGDWSLQE